MSAIIDDTYAEAFKSMYSYFVFCVCALVLSCSDNSAVKDGRNFSFYSLNDQENGKSNIVGIKRPSLGGEFLVQASLILQAIVPRFENLRSRIVVFKEIDDFIIARSNGTPVYNITNVIDDNEMGITHVVRGEDHVTNSAAQIQLFNALGYEVPNLGHLSLISGADGEGLSKRLGSLSLGDLKREGLESNALSSLLALSLIHI